jgi:WD40 repeat protein
VGHATAITALAFHPDGNRLASASSDGTIILWAVRGEVIWKLTQVGSAPIRDGLIFVPDGSALLAAVADGRILRFEAGSGAIRATAKVDMGGMSSLAISPSGRRVAVSDSQGRVRIWDVALSRAGAGVDAGSTITAIAFLGGEDYLVTGGRSIQFWHVPSRRLWLTYDVEAGPVSGLRVDSSRGDLYVATKGATILKIDLNDFHRQLRELAIEIPEFPFHSDQSKDSR